MGAGGDYTLFKTGKSVFYFDGPWMLNSFDLIENGETANVGVAMSSVGSDIATEAAGIALIGDDIEKLPYLCVMARGTFRTIKFGIALSMTINFVAILLSAFGLLVPVTAAIVHNAGSVLVVLIAALLYDRKFMKKRTKSDKVVQMK